jgi:DNA-binding MarR family transcriptional regulator
MTELSLAQFATAVSEIMPVIAREFFKREESGFVKLKMTLPQFLVLVLLDKRGKSSMSDMASGLGVTTAAMTGIVDRLVRDGFIAREHNKDDRRIVNIVEKRRKMIASIFGTLTQQERTDYLRILTRVRDVLTDTV